MVWNHNAEHVKNFDIGLTRLKQQSKLNIFLSNNTVEKKKVQKKKKKKKKKSENLHVKIFNKLFG